VGEDGREGYGEPEGKGELVLANGERVNRYILGSSCQKVLRLTNMCVQPSGDESSCAHPTVESSLAMSPMRSNLGSTTFPLNTPSLLMFMRHSPFGFPASAVFLESAFVTCSVGSGWWKYQYSVAHSIMAIWRVGEAAGLNSLLLGFDMEEM
jgi:hypothetical protein